MNEAILDLPWFSQGQDTTCVPVAVANACLALGRVPPQPDDLIDFFLCRNGGAIQEDKGIQEILGDGAVEKRSRMSQSGPDQELLFNRGGIISLRHPWFGQHAALLLPDGNSTDEWKGWTLINSMLGPNVTRGLSRNEVGKFWPEPPNDLAWVFRRRVIHGPIKRKWHEEYGLFPQIESRSQDKEPLSLVTDQSSIKF